MKIRNGFVSNSSSSSFIIGVPSYIVGQTDLLQQYLFGDNEHYPNPYSDQPYSWPSKAIAAIVMLDMRAEATRKEMVYAYASGYTNSYELAEERARMEFGINRDEFIKDKDTRRRYYDRVDELRTEYAGEVVDRFVKDNPDLKFFVLTYHDNDALGSAMEHGVLFDSIPCLKVSHH